MSEEATAVAEYSAGTKEMGDKIAELTLKQAKELSDYLKDEHGIEPAAVTRAARGRAPQNHDNLIGTRSIGNGKLQRQVM